MTTELRAERRDTALILTMCGPALSTAVCAAGVEALNVAEADTGVRCVVLRGEGPDFCRAAEPEASAATRHFVDALRAFPGPVIACVEGRASDIGFALVLACDLIVAARDTRFALTASRSMQSIGGTAAGQLLQSLPRQRIAEALWLGRGFDAEELHAAGLVHSVVAPGDAAAHALRLAADLGTRLDAATLAASKEWLEPAVSTSGADASRA